MLQDFRSQARHDVPRLRSPSARRGGGACAAGAVAACRGGHPRVASACALRRGAGRSRPLCSPASPGRTSWRRTALAQAGPARATVKTVELDGPGVRARARARGPHRFRPRGDVTHRRGRPWPRRIRLSWYDAERKPAPANAGGSSARLRCRARLRESGRARPRARAAARAHRCDRLCRRDEPARNASPARRCASIERLRERVAGAIAAALPPGPSVAVLQGLAVGVRGNIPDRLWEAFAVTGIAHLMAISGLHVTGCALLVLRAAAARVALPTLPPALAARDRKHRRGRGDRRPMPGFPARRFRRCARSRWLRTGRVTLACGAALPLPQHARARGARPGRRLTRSLVTSAGFWLSFVATAALLAVLSAGFRLAGRLAGFARTQLAITVLLTPVLAAAFGRISLVAPLPMPSRYRSSASCSCPPSWLARRVPWLHLRPRRSSGDGLAWLLDGAWPFLVTVAAWPFAAWAPAAQSPCSWPLPEPCCSRPCYCR